MGEALGYLVCAALGAALLRFAEAIVAAQRRLNAAIAARVLPRSSSRRLKHPNAAYGWMYLLCALGGMMLAVIGLIGFVMSL